MTSKRFRLAHFAGIALILSVGLIAGAGCKKKADGETPETAAGKKLSDMVARATEGKAEIDFQSGQIKVKTAEGDAYITSGGGTWPADMPEDIRQFRGGTIQGSTNSDTPAGKNWMIVFRLVEPESVPAYVKDLENDGWKVIVSSQIDKGIFTQLQKERVIIQLTHMGEEKSLALNVVHSRAD